MKVIRTGRKLFFFQWLESRVVKGEMFSGSCSCACTTRDELAWETLAGPCLVFFLCNSDSLNTSVPPQMSRSHLNLLPPALMLSNSDTSHFPACVLGRVYLYAQPPTHTVLRGTVALASWHRQFSSLSHARFPKLWKISFKASLGCLSPADQACTRWMSWDANDPTGLMWRVAARTNEFRVLLQWMAIKGGWWDRACGHKRPVWLWGKMLLRYGEGCGRDEVFSEHHTRGCQIAFLRAAAFPRTRLDKIWFCTSRWLLPPL